MENNIGDLKVWRIINPPSEPEFYPVATPDEAVTLIDRLAHDDLENDDIWGNAFGLVEWDGEEFVEWYSPDGDDIDEYAARKDSDSRKNEMHS